MDGNEARVEWLTLAGDPDVWRSIGLTVTASGVIPLFGTSLQIVSAAEVPTGNGGGADTGGGDTGIVGWTLSGIDRFTTSIAGLATTVVDPVAPVFADHALGARELDHVVVMTGELDPTTADIARVTGCELKRVRELGQIRQGFHRIGRGGLIVEVVHHADDHRSSPAFWGIVINVVDLDAAGELLGTDRIGEIKDAVQPGRRIATIKSDVGLGLPVALMSL